MVQVKAEHLIVLLMGLFLLHYFMGNCGRRVEGLGWDTGLKFLANETISILPSIIDYANEFDITGTREEGQCCDLAAGYALKRSRNILHAGDNTVCKPGLHCMMGAPAASHNSCPRTKSGLTQDYHGYCNKASTSLDIHAKQNRPK